jgi:hypothetical protein
MILLLDQGRLDGERDAWLLNPNAFSTGCAFLPAAYAAAGGGGTGSSGQSNFE